MNEVEALQSEAADKTQDMGSAGQLLRQARERQGVGLEPLAGMLKVPVEKLAALEAEDWHKLPDAVFARALAQTVCRTLQVDAAPILALLPKGGAAKLSSNPEGLNTPFKDKAMRSSVAGQSEAAGSGLWKFLALGLMAAAGVAALYWGSDWVKGAQDSAAGNAPASSQAPAVAEANLPVQPSFANGVTAVAVTPLTATAATAAVAAQSAEVVAPAAPAAEPVVSSATQSAVSVPSGAAAPLQQAALLPAAAAASAAAAPAAVGAPVTVSEVAVPVLRMRASAQTWVQVRDAQQRVVLEQILQAGGVAETSAARPLFVVVGKADATTVEVDGAALDLAAVARNNVARFEVK